MTQRTLRLRAERLHELSPDELRAVQGGAVVEAVMHTLTPDCLTCQTSIDVHKCAS